MVLKLKGQQNDDTVWKVTVTLTVSLLGIKQAPIPFTCFQSGIILRKTNIHQHT